MKSCPVSRPVQSLTDAVARSTAEEQSRGRSVLDLLNDLSRLNWNHQIAWEKPWPWRNRPDHQHINDVSAQVKTFRRIASEVNRFKTE